MGVGGKCVLGGVCRKNVWASVGMCVGLPFTLMWSVMCSRGQSRSTHVQRVPGAAGTQGGEQESTDCKMDCC